MWEVSINKKTGKAVWNGMDRDDPANEAEFFKVAAAPIVGITRHSEVPAPSEAPAPEGTPPAPEE